MSLLVLFVLQFIVSTSEDYLQDIYIVVSHTLLKNMLECGMHSSSLSLTPCQITESFSAMFSPGCPPESVVVTQASLVCLTRPMQSTRVSQPWVLQSSCTVLSPKTMATESRPFLLANDALIVQVNNLLFFFPPMNNNVFGVRSLRELLARWRSEAVGFLWSTARLFRCSHACFTFRYAAVLSYVYLLLS